MHKIVYHTSLQNKADVSQHLKNIKFVGGFDDWVYETLKSHILLANKQQSANQLTQKTLDAVRIPKNTKKFEGEKNIYVCGEKLHDGLYNACRVENWARRQGNDKAVSFQDFIERIMRRSIDAVLQDYTIRSLDAEKEALKSNKTPKK